jgi:NADH-quinone oxidoreductase subunit A
VTTAEGYSTGAGTLLVAMMVFVAFLVIGFVYEWRKGALEWD